MFCMHVPFVCCGRLQMYTRYCIVSTTSTFYRLDTYIRQSEQKITVLFIRIAKLNVHCTDSRHCADIWHKNYQYIQSTVNFKGFNSETMS